MRARLSPPRVLLPHTHMLDGWFLQPERRPARLPRRTILSRCICRCSRMRVCLSPPRVLLPHTYTQDGWFLQPQFSSRSSLVPSVTMVLLNLVTSGKGGEGLLAKPDAGLIQPLCRRDCHGLPGCQGEKPQGAQAPSHAGICQMGVVREGGPSQHETS